MPQTLRRFQNDGKRRVIGVDQDGSGEGLGPCSSGPSPGPQDGNPFLSQEIGKKLSEMGVVSEGAILFEDQGMGPGGNIGQSGALLGGKKGDFLVFRGGRQGKQRRSTLKQEFELSGMKGIPLMDIDLQPTVQGKAGPAFPFAESAEEQDPWRERVLLNEIVKKILGELSWPSLAKQEGCARKRGIFCVILHLE